MKGGTARRRSVGRQGEVTLRRAVFILALTCVLLLCGGGLLLLAAPAGTGGATAMGSPGIDPTFRTAGQVLLFLSGASGVFGIVSLRIAYKSLVARLDAMRDSGRVGHVEAGHPDLAMLVNATNGLIECSEQQVQRALLQVKELEIQLKVATAERRHAEAIIYSISDAVLVTDAFDDVMLANEAAAKTFDFDLASSTRKPIDAVIRDERMIGLVREMRQSHSRSGRRIVEHRMKSASGDRTYKVTLSTVAGASTQSTTGPTGVVAVLHDMTREKEVAEMKNDFVSSVSHELRTPLASIKAYVEMLIDGEADDEKTKTEFYEIIQGEANRLSRLIDNILNISRIESGLVKINKLPQSPSVIVREAVEVIAPQAKLKNIVLKDDLAPAFYQTQADKDMLYQAVLNLLSNAVKYTPVGGTIGVSVKVDEATKKVVTKITDSGVGIPPKDLPFVFDKFYRADANNHMAKGTGLGLAMVKHIVETVHRGKIIVESVVGKGSTFGFEMDLTD